MTMDNVCNPRNGDDLAPVSLMGPPGWPHALEPVPVSIRVYIPR